MTDDVTNLRKLAEAINGNRPMPLASADLCRRAAAEIERLQLYETELEFAAAVLQSALSADVGLFDVTAGCREMAKEIARLRLKAVKLGEQVVQQADEIERLKAIISADDEYFAITARAAFKMIRGPLTESFHAEQSAVWEKCKSTRKAAEAAGGES